MCQQIIVLGKQDEVPWLSRFIPQELNPVCLIESTRGIDRLPAGACSRLVVAFGSFPGGINLSLLQKVKNKLNASAIICLVNAFSQEAEIELRSAGLVFLGSQLSFVSHAEEIIANNAYVQERPGASKRQHEKHPA